MIAHKHRRDIIFVYLGLRALVLLVSLVALSVAPEQLNQIPSSAGHRRLWEASALFAGWSVSLALVSYSGLRNKNLAFTNRLIALSLFPDSLAIFLAASATGGSAGAIYRGVYLLIAIHSYHFSPKGWAAEPGSSQGVLFRLSVSVALTVLCGMSVFCLLASPATPLVQYAIEFSLQLLVAIAFLLARFSNMKRVQIIARSQEDLGRAQRELEGAKETERRLLEAMQDLGRAQRELEGAKGTERRLLEAVQDASSIARISDETQLDEKLRALVQEIGKSFSSELCALGLVREGRLDVLALHTSFRLSEKERATLRKLGSGQLEPLAQLVLSNRQPLNCRTADELAAVGITFDSLGEPSRAIRHILAAPFYSQDADAQELGCIMLLNKMTDGVSPAEGFTSQDAEHIATIVNQMAVAITNFEHHLQEVARAENQAFLNSLILFDDFDDLFNCVLGYLNREYSSSVASLWLATEDGFGSREETLRVVLRSLIVAEDQEAPGPKSEVEEKLKRSSIFHVSKSFIGQFFRESRSQSGITIVENLDTVNDGWASRLHELAITHLIAIPISHYHGIRTAKDSPALPIAERPLAGVVCLSPLHSFVMTEERRETFERLATYLAVLIDQLRFRRRYRQIEILKNQLPELQAADLTEFYAGVVQLVRDALEAEACSLFTLDPKGALVLKATTAKRAIRIAGDGSQAELSTEDYRGKVVYPVGEMSNASKIAEVGKTTLLYDVYRSPYMSRLFVEVTETPDHQSLIGAPVYHTDGNLFGVLHCINRRKVGALRPVFVEEDKEFLDLIVGIMARFIENAEASASKRDFLTQLAHELATPLAALRNQIVFLEDVTSRGRYVLDSKEHFAYLSEQADFIQYLVSDIQYQFEKGAEIQARYEFSKAVDLTRMIERITGLLLPTARMDKQIDIRTGTSRLPPLFVDPRRMGQVIFNLLQNAVKYSRLGAGDILLVYDLVEDRDSKGSSTKWHRIRVEDWGVGVKESDLPFIFDEYRRGTNVEGAPSGTGLGLAVAKRIIEAHEGRLSVVRLQNPTVFAVDLPEELARRPPNNASSSD